MNIPESLIEPFGVIGIPAITTWVPNPNFIKIDNMLDTYMDHYVASRINNRIEPISQDEMCARLRLVAMAGGASMAHCMHFKFDDKTYIIDYRLHDCGEEHECIVFDSL